MASFKKYEVGIVGATGAVGMEMAKCLFKRAFPVSTLHLYASARSAGKVISTEFGDIVVEEYSVEKATAARPIKTEHPHYRCILYSALP
jgi:aspartate-semialdehyde dehydrogenase